MLSLSRPARQRPTKRLSRPELVVLWIHRARHLAQDLHHTTRIAVEEETPEETVGLIRDAASLKYGSFGNANTAGYFVPPEGTTLFGMAERFVDLYGYHGDASPFDRALMFDNLNTLFRTMVLDEEYLRFGIDFPNFDVSKADLERYGIYEFIKPRQIARLSSEDPGTVVQPIWRSLVAIQSETGGTSSVPISRSVARMTREAVISCPNHRRREVSFTRDRGASEVYRGTAWGAIRPMQIRQLLIRPPGPHVSTISRFLPLLNALSLRGQDIGTRPLASIRGWAAFLEFRLPPMVYFVHAAVTHDFTLVGAKGVYSLVELDHIKYWVGRVTAPLQLGLIVSRRDYCCHPAALNCGVLNLRPPDSSGGKRSRDAALLRTAFDYPAFDEHGQLLIPDFYSVEGGPQDVSREPGTIGGIRFDPIIHPGPRVTRPKVRSSIVARIITYFV
ncbi:hypothetical protein B0H14DRAFT_2554677 [Mycena olivaceomarginata]|nr:hypothetical protein B0H14DRAFT_2554677 [Mycena olivaceomarginata]